MWTRRRSSWPRRSTKASSTRRPRASSCASSTATRPGAESREPIRKPYHPPRGLLRMRWTLWLLAVLGIAQFVFVATAHPASISLDTAYLVMALTMMVLLGGLALGGCGYGCGCDGDWSEGCGCG